MKNKIKNTLSVAAVLIAFCLIVSFLTLLLQPKYMTDLVEGSMTAAYYDQAGGHDVIFIGDCEVYANFIPMEMYRQAGITSYVRGNSQQLIWQSYYLLKETYRYETPKAVVFNVNAMRYSEPVSEAYNRLMMDNMRWSSEKMGMIKASMTEKEDFLSYVFPILRYHSRITQLTNEDLTYLFKEKQNVWQGHLINKGVKPVEKLPAKRPLKSYDFADICWEYLDKMRLLCQENGTELILVKAPSVYPYWYDEYQAQIEEYAEKHGLSFYNLLDVAETIGIDYNLDTYDGGLHLNFAGAKKLSFYFADLLAQKHQLTDHRGENPKFDKLLEEYDQATN